MARLDVQDDKEHLEKIIHTMPKVKESEAEEMYKRGLIKDGVPFLLTQNSKVAFVVTEEGDARGAHWRVGIFVKGKMPFVDYDLGTHGAKRLETLKRSAIAHLLHIAETKWIPLGKSALLPQRWENVETGKILYSASSVEKELEDAKHDTYKVQEDFMPDKKEIEDRAPLAPDA